MLVSTLRQRILGTFATSTLLAAACGGQTTPTSSSGTTTGTSSGGSTTESSSGSSSSGTSGSGTSSSGASSSGTPATCSDGRKERSCFAPDGILTKNSNYGRPPMQDAAPPPPPTREANGCVVLEEVMNGCCNAAIAGPTLEDGKCCYEFCAGSCCGRPLLVDGVARVAPPAARADWVHALPVADMDGPTRAALRDDWTRDALLEHASIASFATFTLELLSLGAPPDLVRDAQAATGDEIEHARLTFSIASSYADEPIGPGSLDLAGITPHATLASVAAACVRDGCINETLASAIAGAQAANAIDPERRATLERIAEDEARHAELAWRFVQWALSRRDADVHHAVLAAFDSAVVDATAPPEGIDTDLWRQSGRLLPAEHAHVVRSVLDQVVRPCRDLLVGSAASSTFSAAATTSTS